MRPDSWISLALFGLSLVWFSLTFTATLDLRDEGYLMLQAAGVAAGAVPHRDFPDVYGPGVFALTGGVLALFDGQLIAVRLLVAAFKALAVSSGYALARRVAPRWLAVAVALLSVGWWGRFAANLNAPYAALFTIPLALAATAFFVRADERRADDGARAVTVAGVVMGVAIVFKQSLGLALAFGLLLSAVAVAWLGARPAPDPRRSVPASLFAGGFLLAGFLPVLPLSRWLTAGDWVLHLLPLRAILVALAVLGWLRGAPPVRAVFRRVWPLAAGIALAPLGVAIAYAALGGLPELWRDLFVLPFSLRGYAQPAVLPPLALGLWLAVASASVVTVLLALAGRARPALAAAACAAALFAAGAVSLPAEAPALRDPAVLLARGPFALEALYLPGLLLLGLALSLPRLRDPEAARARIPLLVVSAMLAFEVFPRAGHDLWIVHGALAPLWALVLGELFERTGAARAPGWRRGAAAVALLAIPCWLVAPLVATVVSPDPATGERRALAFERARGLRLDAVQRREQRVEDVEALVAWLDDREPRGAPLFLLTNERMIPFLAGRPAFLPEQTFALFLAGWGMLGSEGQERLRAAVTPERLLEQPELLVIHRPDPSAAELRRTLPGVRDVVEREFRVVERFGEYRVLARIPDPGRAQ